MAKSVFEGGSGDRRLGAARSAGRGSLGPTVEVGARRGAAERARRGRTQRRCRPWQVRLEVENARRQVDIAELRDGFRDLVAGLPWLWDAAPDPAIGEIAAALGFARQDLAIAGAVVGTPVTLVGVPDPVWHNPARRRDLERLRRRARRAGCRALIVSWRDVFREPRFGNAAMAASAAREGSSACDRTAILDLVSNGSTTNLAALTASAGRDGAASAALHLVALGALHVPPGAALGPVTPLRRGRRGSTPRGR